MYLNLVCFVVKYSSENLLYALGVRTLKGEKNMILATEKDIQRIFDYIGDDFGKCAYLYLDFKEYGVSNENVKLWFAEDKCGDISAITLKYYNGQHLFSRENNFDSEEVAELVKRESPIMLCGMKNTLEKIKPFFPNNNLETGKVLQLIKDDYSGITHPNAKIASPDDIDDIVDLLMTDDVMGSPYTRDLLKAQFEERFRTGFGRSFIVRTDDGKLLGTSGSYAEIDNMSVISGGIVSEESREQGIYSAVLGSICKSLLDDGKTCISYYYKHGIVAHNRVGFKILGDWAKLELDK